MSGLNLRISSTEAGSLTLLTAMKGIPFFRQNSSAPGSDRGAAFVFLGRVRLVRRRYAQRTPSSRTRSRRRTSLGVAIGASTTTQSGLKAHDDQVSTICASFLEASEVYMTTVSRVG